MLEQGLNPENMEELVKDWFEELVSRTNDRVLSYEKCIPDVIPPPPFKFVQFKQQIKTDQESEMTVANDSLDVASMLHGKIVEFDLLNGTNIFSAPGWIQA